ncbi:Lrp/AsnC family transcriptional regulator [uncultured Shimia sp.]|uniref:Lrp/AsnC family transcriptional regulator n=1 Tax=uncultured Shimia sp. TaxID=573152 RepID=UPI0026077519|nr:Lrp/AsnC family transcriptional regulator [uncultured Shimia sp.]
MDDLDHRLLQLLTKDARTSVTDLSVDLGVSRGTVQNRIDKLLHTRVIQRFTVELGSSEDDHQVSALTMIRLKADDGKVTIAALKRIEEIFEIHTLSGNFDMVVEVRSASLKRLEKTLDRIRSLPDVAETQSHIKLSTISSRKTELRRK